MNLCIPVDADQGLDSPVSAHFGLTRFYLIIDTRTGQHRTMANRNPHYYGGDCQPMANLSSEHIDVVVTGGVGLRALARLQAAGIQVFLSESTSLAETLGALKAGTLRAATTETACRSGDGRPPTPGDPLAHGSCCHSC